MYFRIPDEEPVFAGLYSKEKQNMTASEAAARLAKEQTLGFEVIIPRSIDASEVRSIRLLPPNSRALCGRCALTAGWCATTFAPRCAACALRHTWNVRAHRLAVVLAIIWPECGLRSFWRPKPSKTSAV